MRLKPSKARPDLQMKENEKSKLEGYPDLLVKKGWQFRHPRPRGTPLKNQFFKGSVRSGTSGSTVFTVSYFPFPRGLVDHLLG